LIAKFDRTEHKPPAQILSQFQSPPAGAPLATDVKPHKIAPMRAKKAEVKLEDLAPSKKKPHSKIPLGGHGSIPILHNTFRLDRDGEHISMNTDLDHVRERLRKGAADPDDPDLVAHLDSLADRDHHEDPYKFGPFHNVRGDAYKIEVRLGSKFPKDYIQAFDAINIYIIVFTYDSLGC
jgi:hypothetical protein